MRIRNVKDQQELERVVDDFITQGYKDKSRGEKSVKLKKAEYGGLLAHILIFAIIGWFTLGLANVAYAAYKYYTGDEVLVKINEDM